jgi:hypothetical protein
VRSSCRVTHYTSLFTANSEESHSNIDFEMSSGINAAIAAPAPMSVTPVVFIASIAAVPVLDIGGTT